MTESNDNIPTLLLWYFDSDIWFALLTTPEDKARAAAVSGCNIAADEVPETLVTWLAGLDIALVNHYNPARLPPLPNGAQIITVFGR
jgi:hypothetical protein